MSDFDPEAFLAEGGDSFDPYAFLGKEKPSGKEYGLGWQKVGAPDEKEPEPTKAERIANLLAQWNGDTARKSAEQDRQLRALGIGAATVLPKLAGVRQDLGQLGAGIVDKMFGSEKPFGVLVQDSKPQIERFYSDVKEEQPIATAVGEGLGMAPVSPFSAGASALGKTLSPFAAKLLAAGGSGLDAALQSGLNAYQDSDAAGTEGKVYDAASQAVLGGALGAAIPLAPEAITSTSSAIKRGFGKSLQAPKTTMTKLYEMLGGNGDDAAAPLAAQEATQVDNVIPIGKGADEETKAIPFLKRLHMDEHGGSNPPKFKAQDPEFIRKSGELAKMLGVSDEAAAPVAAVKTPRGGAPKDPRSRYFGYGSPHDGKTVLDSDEQIADWNMGMLGEDGRPFFANKYTPEEQAELRAALQKAQAMDAAPKTQAGNFEAKTGQGGGDLYQPMGAPAAAAQQADPTRRMNPREINSLLGLSDEGYEFYKPEEIARIMEEVNAQGAKKSGGWYKPEPDGPTVDAERIARGREVAREWAGRIGAATGAYGGLKAGAALGPWGIGGGIAGGANLGKSSAHSTFDTVDKYSNKLAEWGQKMLTNPAKLAQIEQQGGQMGSAASFVMDGARSGGESGMAARAFIVSQQPFWREWLAQNGEQD